MPRNQPAALVPELSCNTTPLATVFARAPVARNVTVNTPVPGVMTPLSGLDGLLFGSLLTSLLFTMVRLL